MVKKLPAGYINLPNNSHRTFKQLSQLCCRTRFIFEANASTLFAELRKTNTAIMHPSSSIQ